VVVEMQNIQLIQTTAGGRKLNDFGIRIIENLDAIVLDISELV
jgi:hypothetical protein